MKKGSLLASTIVGSALLSLPVAAQDAGQDSITDTIVVHGKQDSYFAINSSTALKSEALESETPYQASVRNETLLRDLQVKNLEDALLYTTGVSQSGYLADGVVIRGFDVDLNNIKVDGMSGLTTRFGSPSTANIERIEVLKGPASVLYGNMETGGMVNMITKRPEQEFSASVTTSLQTFATGVAGFGTDNGVNTVVDVTGPVGSSDNLFYRFIGTADYTDSFRKDVNHQEYYIFPSLFWEINPSSNLLLSLEAGKQTGDADHGLAAAQQDINTVAPIDTVYQEQGDYDNDQGAAFNAEFNHELANGTFTFKWRSVWHEDERRLYENNKVLNVDLSAGEDIADTRLRRRNRHQKNKRDWHSFDTFMTHEVATGPIMHDLTFGVAGEYRLTDFDRLAHGSAGNVSPHVSLYDPVLGGTAATVAGNRRSTEYFSFGAYAQDKISLTDGLTLVTSGRLNRTKIDYNCLRGSCNADNTIYSTDAIGSAGLVAAVTDNFSLYTNVAQSFDPYTAERVDINGKALEAETSLQFEGGARYAIGEQFNASVSAYQITKDNVSESLGGGAYETIGQVQSKGIEVDLQWLPMPNWQVVGGYAFNHSEATKGEYKGLRPAHTPKHTAFVFTRYNLDREVWGGTLGLSAGVTFKDEVKTDISPSKSVDLPSYALADLGAYYDKGAWSAAFHVQNVFDKTHYYAGSDDQRIYVGDPRKFSLTVSRKF